ncbi:MAG: PQQ-like beta-propeller repeat protein [Sedimentisphaerales bacterium]|nr:PQQ-like beta-propeller repeat protein [Sedimentisphaerales bacterium]
MKHRAQSVTVVLLAILMATSTWAASGQAFWPTWRGPDGTGTALQGDPPITWSETQNVKWKVEIPGKGQSSPVIWADKIFFLTAIDTGPAGTAEPRWAPPASPQAPARGGRGGRGGGRGPTTAHKFDVICLDRATGKTLWQKTAAETVPHEGHQQTGSFAPYSPVTDGKLVWVSFGSRGLHCYDLDGNLKWSKPLIQMTTRMGFGEGSSPCLAGDAIVVVCDHEGQSVIFAFNKETGESLWQKDRDERTSWATPVAAEVDGKVQVITAATNLIRSYDAGTGELIWQCGGMTDNAIPTPVVAFDRVYCISGFRGSSLMAIELGRTGDLTGTDAVAWKMSDGTPYVPSGVLMGERLFFCASGNNQGIVSCYHAKTGEALFSKERLEGVSSIYASFVGVADRVYILGRDGTVAVIKNADTYEVLATNKLDDGFDATPAIIGDELYLRGNQNFYCIAKQ